MLACGLANFDEGLPSWFKVDGYPPHSPHGKIVIVCCNAGQPENFAWNQRVRISKSQERGVHAASAFAQNKAEK